MTAIFVSFWTIPPLPLWDQTTNSQTNLKQKKENKKTNNKKKNFLFLIFPQTVWCFHNANNDDKLYQP